MGLCLKFGIYSVLMMESCKREKINSYFVKNVHWVTPEKVCYWILYYC